MKDGNLGQTLVNCSRYGISQTEGGTKHNNFLFTANKHSTGISVTANIIHPDTNEAYEIINGTYWYSESTYGFNEFKWLKGEWDEALTNTIKELKALVSQTIQAEQETNQVEKSKQDAEEQKEKEKYEALF